MLVNGLGRGAQSSAAPGQRVRLKAVAGKPGSGGKPATELALEPNQSIFEVNLESPDFAIVLPPRTAPTGCPSPVSEVLPPKLVGELP
jgi:hypothetical protein